MCAADRAYRIGRSGVGMTWVSAFLPYLQTYLAPGMGKCVRIGPARPPSMHCPPPPLLGRPAPHALVVRFG
jgi:hypothetical protein